MASGELPALNIFFDLPDLPAVTDHPIVPANIRALQPIYLATMLEELKVFQVVDKLVELFQNGALPVTDGEAGDKLFNYMRAVATRMSEPERRSFYARALGMVGGDSPATSNREFNDLWLRFVSTVSSLVRQQDTEAPASGEQQVRETGRDLAANLSLHGCGIAYFAAIELHKQIKDMIHILSDPEIQNAFGARDWWQGVDQIATRDLGGAGNSVRYRTMASSGGIVLSWLAANVDRLSANSFDPTLDTTAAKDVELVNACEQWLAVAGSEEIPSPDPLQ